MNVIFIGGDANANAKKYLTPRQLELVVLITGGGVPLKIVAGKTLSGVKAFQEALANAAMTTEKALQDTINPLLNSISPYVVKEIKRGNNNIALTQDGRNLTLTIPEKELSPGKIAQKLQEFVGPQLFDDIARDALVFRLQTVLKDKGIEFEAVKTAKKDLKSTLELFLKDMRLPQVIKKVELGAGLNLTQEDKNLTLTIPPKGKVSPVSIAQKFQKMLLLNDIATDALIFRLQTANAAMTAEEKAIQDTINSFLNDQKRINYLIAAYHMRLSALSSKRV